MQVDQEQRFPKSQNILQGQNLLEERNQKLLIQNIKKQSWRPFVEGDQKASFSKATTLRCRGGRYSIPRETSLHP